MFWPFTEANVRVKSPTMKIFMACYVSSYSAGIHREKEEPNIMWEVVVIEEYTDNSAWHTPVQRCEVLSSHKPSLTPTQGVTRLGTFFIRTLKSGWEGKWQYPNKELFSLEPWLQRISKPRSAKTLSVWEEWQRRERDNRISCWSLPLLYLLDVKSMLWFAKIWSKILWECWWFWFFVSWGLRELFFSIFHETSVLSV